MKPILFLAISLVACSPGWAADEKGAQTLEGTWNATLWQDNDRLILNPVDIDLVATITADAFTMNGGGRKKSSKYKLDTTKTPAQIDLVPETGAKKGKTLKGIYKLKGDVLVLCLNSSEGNRPTEFDPEKKRSFVVIEFKRAKK